jgi:hypothetical protein
VPRGPALLAQDARPAILLEVPRTKPASQHVADFVVVSATSIENMTATIGRSGEDRIRTPL